MTNELLELQNSLTRRVSGWSLPPGILMDDIVGETMAVYWDRLSHGEHIEQPIHWLLRTAKFKYLEMSRQRGNTQSASAELLSEVPGSESALADAPTPAREMDLGRSEEWQNLSSQKQSVIRESIMYGRSLAEVAKEANVNRSTAKSWVSRSIRRMASDPYLQSLHYERN